MLFRKTILNEIRINFFSFLEFISLRSFFKLMTLLIIHFQESQSESQPKSQARARLAVLQPGSPSAQLPPQPLRLPLAVAFQAQDHPLLILLPTSQSGFRIRMLATGFSRLLSAILVLCSQFFPCFVFLFSMISGHESHPFLFHF